MWFNIEIKFANIELERRCKRSYNNERTNIGLTDTALSKISVYHAYMYTFLQGYKYNKFSLLPFFLLPSIGSRFSTYLYPHTFFHIL